MMQRRRGAPARPSCHATGVLPYIWFKKSFKPGPRKTDSTSAARARVCVAVHCGSTPACTIKYVLPATVSQIARRCRHSHASMAGRSGARSTLSSVSLRPALRTPCATASRCRSWLPSRHCADAPSNIRRRNTAAESGPRFTRSPSRKIVSRLGENAMSSSRRCNAPSQPCTSPIKYIAMVRILTCPRWKYF